MRFLPMMVIAGAVVPLIAVAQSAGQPQPAGKPGGAGGAGTMTLAQFEARHERKLMAADTDHDGRVSKAEFLAAARPGPGDPARRFAKADRNGDGYLDRAEIDAMLQRRFKRIDTNGDGLVTPAERAAAKAARPRSGSGDQEP